MDVSRLHSACAPVQSGLPTKTGVSRSVSFASSCMSLAACTGGRDMLDNIRHVTVHSLQHTVIIL